MKRPTLLVKELIEKSTFPHDEIYENSIPEEVRDSAKVTQILLTESNSAPNSYGNSQFATMLWGVNILIFYSTELESDVIDEELDLMQLLIDNNWLITKAPPRYEDPDTGQIIKNIQVRRTLTLKEMKNL